MRYPKIPPICFTLVFVCSLILPSRSFAFQELDFSTNSISPYEKSKVQDLKPGMPAKPRGRIDFSFLFPATLAKRLQKKHYLQELVFKIASKDRSKIHDYLLSILRNPKAFGDLQMEIKGLPVSSEMATNNFDSGILISMYPLGETGVIQFYGYASDPHPGAKLAQYSDLVRGGERKRLLGNFDERKEWESKYYFLASPDEIHKVKISQ